MDPNLIALVAAFGGAVLGALVSTLGTMPVQRTGRRRSSRAHQLRDLLLPARRRAEDLMGQVVAGRGPITTARLEDELEFIEREALAAGRLDGERARPVVEVARELWRLDRRVWEKNAIGREPKMDVDEALDQQVRALSQAVVELDNYELWLRGRLEKPWWRRRAGMSELP